MSWLTLLPLALCGALAGPVARGLAAIRALEMRVATSKRRLLRRLVLARTFHRPLYAACGVLLLLRAAFCLLVALDGNADGNTQARVAYFWLLDAPSVALVALHGYVALFTSQLTCGKRWTASSSRRNGASMLSVVYTIFCAALALLTTLVAICRGLEGEHLALLPREMALGYMSIIWSVLGLLVLKGQAETDRMTRTQRLRQPWGLTDAQERPANAEIVRLRALETSCLRHLSRSSTLLALLLVARGLYCAVIALQQGQTADKLLNPQEGEGIWLQICALALDYGVWELGSVAVVLYLLRKMPIAVYYRATAASNGVEDPTRPQEPQDEVSLSVHFEFHVPSVHEVVHDYVLAPRQTLFQQRSRTQGWRDDDEARRHCVHDPGASSVGAEYSSCRCAHHHERRTEQFLTSANVPLLADEYRPVGDERPAAMADQPSL